VCVASVAGNACHFLGKIMLTLIYGDDLYLVNLRKEMLLKSRRSEGGRDIESWRADEGEITPSQLISAVVTPSLFASRKSVFIDNLESAPVNFIEEITRAFCSDYAGTVLSDDALEVVLIYRGGGVGISVKGKKNNPLAEIRKVASKIYEEKSLSGSALISWAKNLARNFGKELSSGAAEILISESKGEMGIIASEIEKCSIAVGSDKKVIDEKNVLKNLFETAGGNIFTFASAVGEKRNIRSALKELGLLLESSGEEPLVVLDRFQKVFLRIYRYHIYKSEGMTRGEMFSRLGLHSYFDRDFFSNTDASGYSRESAAAALIRAAKVNLRLKRLRTADEKNAALEILTAESLMDKR